jgi:hypothetical protein
MGRLVRHEIGSEGREMKVLGIGLGRTGTMSLARALEILGYKTKHCPGFYLDAAGKLCISQEDIEQYEALTDEPTILVYKEVDRRYPDGKFILTVREMASWWTSIWNNGTALREWRAKLPAVPVLHQALYGTATLDRAMYEAAYRQHVRDVQAYFRDRPHDLLVMDICAGEGWGKLCPFLGKPVPGVPFPRLNVFGESDFGTVLQRGKVEPSESVGG